VLDVSGVFCRLGRLRIAAKKAERKKMSKLPLLYPSAIFTLNNLEIFLVEGAFFLK
jgi:hypothetical protein